MEFDEETGRKRKEMTVRFGGHTYESGSAMKSSRESAEESNR